MPIRKLKSGYFWGSHGPFKTKTKARQVEKAAYASGYRSKENTMKKKKQLKTSKPGSTKVKSGITYRLNRNYRWEKCPGSKIRSGGRGRGLGIGRGTGRFGPRGVPYHA